jgi:hypothetical protein
MNGERFLFGYTACKRTNYKREHRAKFLAKTQINLLQYWQEAISW